ncbi:MAG: hypothetical protein J7604_07050 [Sporocytophaga sp.]|uniref:hypothetical protein n=1 Tax=Sporocytophaga sp. TaxID=2231183 RepID=UPI001B250C19|nr:hypothetical protein [Sporocytophaga sp.]MBO9699950.1 hypothetical protein [Sporocytophaga sp.]
MKSRKILFSLIGMLFLLNSCTTTTVVLTKPNGKVPPGQMKKYTGAKSAKAYAPGQQNKAGGPPTNNSHAPGQKKKK